MHVSLRWIAFAVIGAVSATVVEPTFAGTAGAQTSNASPQPTGRYPCRTQPEAQQFDFWIGEWDVSPWNAPQAPLGAAGFNDVHPILEHCIVFENWKGTAGGEGKSFNYFDRNINKWRQVWMADNGTALDYTGEFRDGAMRFTAWTRDAQGRRVEQKLTFTPFGRDTVRQTFEASTDGGKTWNVTFDGRYVRRQSRPGN